MKKLLILFVIIFIFILSCASVKTYRDDLKGFTKYYTDDFVEWGAFLNIILYDNALNKPVIVLYVRTQSIPDYINLKEVYFYDEKTRDYISFKLDEAKNDLVYLKGYYTGYAYMPSQIFKIAKGIKLLNEKELDVLYNFIINSKNTYIRFYGDFQTENPLPDAQRKNIIELIEKYKKEIYSN
ncbi:hypothetical protein [Brachyspira sp.]|uniref:hypothetical protein n=1 Tax=Brachyspira sp. TaxID=1977261 RepID=UPI0026131202|nr:hypothetical protein [Brachyspira sp.]